MSFPRFRNNPRIIIKMAIIDSKCCAVHRHPAFFGRVEDVSRLSDPRNRILLTTLPRSSVTAVVHVPNPRRLKRLILRKRKARFTSREMSLSVLTTQDDRQVGFYSSYLWRRLILKIANRFLQPSYRGRLDGDGICWQHSSPLPSYR